MTAPVPPDANGLREDVLREAADLLHVHRFDHRKDAGDVGGPDSFYRGVQWCRDYLRSLAASEAAPTAGEKELFAYDDATLNLAAEHGCLDEDVHTGDQVVCTACASPATPPADDATEGLSEAECNRLANFLDFYSRGAESISGLVDEVAGIKSAAADRARAEGAAEALNVLREHSVGAYNGTQSVCSRCRKWMTHDEYRMHLASLIARSDAAPHTGGPS